MATTHINQLPLYLLTKIFIQYTKKPQQQKPVKNLMQLRCVCKSWDHVNRSWSFIQDHLNHQKTSSNANKYLLLDCGSKFLVHLIESESYNVLESHVNNPRNKNCLKVFSVLMNMVWKSTETHQLIGYKRRHFDDVVMWVLERGDNQFLWEKKFTFEAEGKYLAGLILNEKLEVRNHSYVLHNLENGFKYQLRTPESIKRAFPTRIHHFVESLVLLSGTTIPPVLETQSCPAQKTKTESSVGRVILLSQVV